MRYAIIENGIITNIAVADCPIQENWIEEDGEARIGGAWDGERFHPKVINPEEVAFGVRAQRDSLLKDSDWTQLPDVPDAIKTAWATYRQALRDIPQQTGFPLEVIWPTQPE